MICNQCGETSSREFSIVASVTRITNKKIVLELTEPQDRPIKVGKPLPYSFPFYLREGTAELEFCNINCAKLFLIDKVKEINEKIKR